ncbi:phage head morphogenesis protein [Salmonella enterica]|nr:phage head morphogenesis protein [Salmonella enterica]EBG8070650.1 phage head morphogenesis protein [Salmonella enterica subsp. enterica serovar Elisabethville]EED8015229.1 phage head morphogenesis protein [Salmonella enterica subsp. enterica]EBH3514511.1 phage head morphogenesis protein [Salmonella enterica subsp. enterica serovar Elisabethville]EBH6160369.1 phage head morphogenesis protein [Salmonella enterica]
MRFSSLSCGVPLMPTSDSSSDFNLGYAVKLEPEAAVDYFRAKGYAVTDDWREMLHEQHARAFTVAKATGGDVLTTIRSAVDDALANGVTERQFMKQLAPELQRLGWWGRVDKEAADGSTVSVQLGSPARLKTIYRTNMITAYQSGRYLAQQASSDTRPYWTWVSIIDDHSRAHSIELNNRTFLNSDPFWASFYPPVDWGCRCRVRAQSERRLKENGLSVESSDGLLTPMTVDAGTDAISGVNYQTEIMQFRCQDENGKTVNLSPAPGWSYNVGSAAFGTDVSVARKLIEMTDRPLRQQLIQSLNNSPVRLAEFGDWVDNVLAARRPGSSVQPVAFIDDALTEEVRLRAGTPPARLAVINEKQLIHADSTKHQQTGVALTAQEYRDLPSYMANPKAILWDTQHKNLIYLADSASDPRAIKIALDTDQSVKKRPDRLDVLVNAYRMDWSVIQGYVQGGVYEVLRGTI